MTKLHQLAELGQAAWFDFILRSFTRSGELTKLIDQGIRGVTSNPSIFKGAIVDSDDYDEDLRKADPEQSAEEVYEGLAFTDIREAADLLRPIYDETGGGDGFVSLEVSPALAHDTDGTIMAAKRLFDTVDRPNLLIKIPATSAGIPAIEAVIGAGINVNVTLIFSVEKYEASAKAYISGLKKLQAAGGDVSRVASVASVFISRVDRHLDDDLKERGETDMVGTIAIDNARIVYSCFQELFSGSRWDALAQAGARVQRPLWASIGLGNPPNRDTVYVDELIGPDTVSTIPPTSLEAFMDHGVVANTITNDLDGAKSRRARLEAHGFDLTAITEEFLDEGVEAFVSAFDALLAGIDEKRKTLAG